ncbi:minor capsid protein [Faecalibacillus intestinalis]|uniref:minor capsid protein n=1 Tax=Faecalibacillus intestinalis TaxID=1982626 RepID=UPI0018AC663A|nr:minor capsid protein [Faecalibacillus intestinalis]
MKISVDVDFGSVKKGIESTKEKAYMTLKNDVIRDTDPYVPFSNMHHTHLRETPDMNKEPKQVIYDTEYAQRVYKGTSMNFDKSRHPKATAKWFEKSKKANIKKWIKSVEDVFRNGK